MTYIQFSKQSDGYTVQITGNQTKGTLKIITNYIKRLGQPIKSIPSLAK